MGRTDSLKQSVSLYVSWMTRTYINPDRLKTPNLHVDIAENGHGKSIHRVILKEYKKLPVV